MNKDMNFKTLTELLIARELEHEKGITFIITKTDEEFYSYHEVVQKAKLVLGYLQENGLKPEDKLVLRLQDNRDFIITFWACILGGIIPVPLIADEIDEYRRKLFNVLITLEDAWIIGDDSGLDKLETFAINNNYNFNLVENRFFFIDKAMQYQHSGEVYRAEPWDTAFIQFSSGSTGFPKGVVLTHDNLLTNLDAIIQGAAITSGDVVISWMPLTHDMGLIGGHLTPVAANFMQCSMNTYLFVRRPYIWLEKITYHRATIIASPNFGLQHSKRTMERSKNKNYNFSSVRIILNGAEPISIDTCQDFLDTASHYGMKHNVMFPVYGMAEASLAIAFPKLNENNLTPVVVDRTHLKIGEPVTYLKDKTETNAARYVNEGYAVKNCEIRICDEQDRILDQDQLGIIQIKGKNVTKGYYANPIENNETFTQDGWLRTGDIGFYNKDRLVVVGRQKEMLIIHGQNYFPDDLERIASKIDQLDENKIIVTSCKDFELDEERVVAFVNHKGDLEDFIPLIYALKSRFSTDLGITLDDVVPVAKIPKTSSGKPMRFKLREDFEANKYKEVLEQCVRLLEEKNTVNPVNDSSDKGLSQYQVQNVRTNILEICREIAPEIDIGFYNHFFEYGINSLLLNQISGKLEETYEMSFPNDVFFKYPSIDQLASYICGTADRDMNYKQIDKDESVGHSDIAIVGIAANLPGASDIREYWANLLGEVESVGPLPFNRRLDLEDYLNSFGSSLDDLPTDAGYLYEIDKFDYKFFKILKKEAIAMSPHQRLFLQTAYASMEDAGYGGDALKSSKTGVYVGYISDLDDQQYQKIVSHSADSQTSTGALSSNISGRLSYFMDFKGPSMNVDTACSSSMAALNLAAQAIQNGDCEQAIVGGVEIKTLPMKKLERLGFESEDGHTRPFADDADGTGVGEGVVSILIKPYHKAIEEKDNIYSIIRSISVNQDGHSAGISAPNPVAQTDLIHKGLRKAGLKAEDITYIEAHGTGTKLGDPIEFNALTEAFRSTSDTKQYCGLGSVKSNIGHLYAASGLASIVKACMMLRHKKIPASINASVLHKEINFEDSPFYLNRKAQDWQTHGSPRRCGVSNFGYSGTNFHTILEENMPGSRILPNDKVYPFILSAPSKKQLDELVESYHQFLSMNDTIPLLDLSFTLACGRGHYPYRAAFVAKNTNEIIDKLERFIFKTSMQDKRYVGKADLIQGIQTKMGWGQLAKEDLEQLNQLTKESLVHYSTNHSSVKREQLLHKLCQFYVRGSDPIWHELFKEEEYRRVSLLTYQYEEIRCWPEVRLAAEGQGVE